MTVDTQLQAFHGSALVLSGVLWLIATQIVREPLQGRFILEGLGPDYHEVLDAAADRHKDTVDVSTRFANYPKRHLVVLEECLTGCFTTMVVRMVPILTTMTDGYSLDLKIRQRKSVC